MSLRRTGRRATSAQKPSVQPSVHRGLLSIAAGNEQYISKMLSINDNSTTSDVTEALEACMNMNNLSAEMLLARFFDSGILAEYCETTLQKSGKGSAAILAARIAREWVRPSFLAVSNVAKREPNNDRATVPQKKRARTSKSSTAILPAAEPSDWRTPLFFWKGLLQLELRTNSSNTDDTSTHHKESADPSRCTSAADPDASSSHGHAPSAACAKLRYSGSWVSGLADRGVPADAQYIADAAQSSFDLVAQLDQTLSVAFGDRSETVDASSSSMSLAALDGWTGSFHGHYLLDQGDGAGATRVSDWSHDVAVQRHGSRLFFAACGTTEFGAFVSLGYTSTIGHTTAEAELVLARRYITDADVRSALVKSKAFLMQGLESCKRFSSLLDESMQTSFWTDTLPVSIE
eukprot:m.237447 g.237447  ORF g.237447 m.237447 type:complete len:405 (-) comp19371_c0_seq1:252-1466(-)